LQIGGVTKDNAERGMMSAELKKSHELHEFSRIKKVFTRVKERNDTG